MVFLPTSCPSWCTSSPMWWWLGRIYSMSGRIALLLHLSRVWRGRQGLKEKSHLYTPILKEPYNFLITMLISRALESTVFCLLQTPYQPLLTSHNSRCTGGARSTARVVLLVKGSVGACHSVGMFVYLFVFTPCQRLRLCHTAIMHTGLLSVCFLCIHTGLSTACSFISKLLSSCSVLSAACYLKLYYQKENRSKQPVLYLNSIINFSSFAIFHNAISSLFSLNYLTASDLFVLHY